MNFKNLQITAYMQSNIVCDDFLPFDGILYYFACQQKYGFQEYTLPGINPKIDVILPLKRVNNKNEWFYSASWAYPLQAWFLSESVCNWTKSFDLNYSDLTKFKNKAKVENKKGKYKSYNMPVFYKVTDKIIWYVVGDKEEIASILQFAQSIGKKTSQGWGRVKKWAVEEIKEDWSIRKDGKLTRGVPVSYDKNTPGQIINYGFRPSYWQKENQGAIVV